jgi:hypothetical protein
MTDSLSRITLEKANVIVDGGKTTVIGYIIEFESETSAKRDIERPVTPDEPDTEIEVGYSRNVLEPLTLVFRDKKVNLTLSAFILFRYVNDLFLMEGRTEFDFAELSESITGDEFGKSKTAIETLVRRIAIALEKLHSPIRLIYNREVLYVQRQL